MLSRVVVEFKSAHYFLHTSDQSFTFIIVPHGPNPVETSRVAITYVCIAESADRVNTGSFSRTETTR